MTILIFNRNIDENYMHVKKINDKASFFEYYEVLIIQDLNTSAEKKSEAKMKYAKTL